MASSSDETCPPSLEGGEVEVDYKAVDVIIVGGGISGVSLAYYLKKHFGITNVVVVEGRERTGGRIHTAIIGESKVKVEMGATWVFPNFVQLPTLLQDLKLELVPQYMEGKTIFENSRGGTRAVDEGNSGWEMPRVRGGTGAIIDSLLDTLDPRRVLVDHQVDRIDLSSSPDKVVVSCTNGRSLRGSVVVTSLPPQLLPTIAFSPPLPAAIVSVASSTQTWMGESGKVCLSFRSPVWRDRGNCGAFYSERGPIVQMYSQDDDSKGQYALVGFVDVNTLIRLSQEQRKELVLTQLVGAFGTEIRDSFLHYSDTLWPTESLTMPSSVKRLGRHQNNGHEYYQKAHYEGRLWIGGTESSTEYSGYMEGAVYRAKELAAVIKASINAKV